ncbi:MAG: peptidylprolyl isomerase [Clostridia bacterium]|nr:peptidylprolyl isomerase [Clostridia bacterium]
MKIRIASLLLSVLLCLFALLLCGCAHKAPDFAELDFTTVDPAACTETDEVTDLVKISVKGFGDIIVRLYPNVAPKTVENFQNLVADHYYDGLIFHRVVKGFMIQGGDIDGDGVTNDGTPTIKGEFSANGFENNLKHIRGVISMARLSNDMNSASTQFFIVHKTDLASDLNGDYASFGYVIAGIEVVDAIANVPVKNNATGKEKSTPVTPVVIESVRFVKVSE